MSVAISGATVAACGVGPDEYSDELIRRGIPTPIEYAAWWDEISECSGEQGDFDALRVYVVVAPLELNGTAFPCGGELCNGIWERPHDITFAPAHIGDETLVKHEMLHDLIRVAGHPAVFEECGVTWGNGAADIVPRRPGGAGSGRRTAARPAPPASWPAGTGLAPLTGPPSLPSPPSRLAASRP
ncbi:MAG: hypothetical protein R3195_00900 [Gemmatimonadota bacterium]|nr:hypothetical protein [Gemmatimonadota bacterium]